MPPLDGCVVPTEPVAAVVGSFLEKWSRERPQAGGQFSSDPNAVSPVRGIAWLASAANLPEGVITNVAQQRRPTVTLAVADAILSALDQADLLRDGTIPVRPNPRATQRARQECCTEDELRSLEFQIGASGSSFPGPGTSAVPASLLGVATA